MVCSFNLILIVCRFHIYRMKDEWAENLLLVLLLKQEVNRCFVMQIMSFVKNNNLDKFITKWEPFSLLCSN